MSLQQINVDLRDAGIHALHDFVDKKPVKIRRVECGCGAHAEISYDPRASFDWVVKSFSQKGWTVGKRSGKAYCPTCRNSKGVKQINTALSGEEKARIKDLYAQGFNTTQIVEKTGVSLSTIWKLLNKEGLLVGGKRPRRAEDPVTEADAAPPAVEAMAAEIRAETQQETDDQRTRDLVDATMAEDSMNRVEALGGIFEVHGEVLRVKVPKGALTDDLRARITACKSGIMRLLGAPSQADIPGIVAELLPEPAPEPEPAPTFPQALTIAQICSAISFLNRYFHDGRYAEGWSDARVASVLELPPEQVAQVRMESPDHGPIRTAPEVEALKADIASLEALFTEQVSELRARLAPLEAME